MKAIAFVIGTEILDGKTIDSNSITLYNFLKFYGIELNKKVILKDEINLISYNLKKELTNYDLFFCLGGLGPTFDDITIDAVSSALNIDYKYNKEATNKILNFLKSRKIEDEKLINLNLRQARYIGSPLMNGAGFAVGSFLKLKKSNNDKLFFLLPGPPNEFEYILNNSINPIIRNLAKNRIFQKNLYIYNISESSLNKLLQDLNLKTFSGIYAKSHLKIITLESDKISTLENDLKKISKLENILGFYINEISSDFIFNKEKIENRFFITDKDIIITEPIEFNQIFFDFLSKKNITFSASESCSGGLLSQTFTSIPSASKFFLGSIICYSNESKEKLLSIQKDIIEKYGAVSQEVTKLLSEKIKELLGSDFSIAITGFAGPETGFENYPVGTCFIGISFENKSKMRTEIFHSLFKGNRISIQNLSVIFSMFLAKYLLCD